MVLARQSIFRTRVHRKQRGISQLPLPLWMPQYSTRCSTRHWCNLQTVLKNTKNANLLRQRKPMGSINNIIKQQYNFALVVDIKKNSAFNENSVKCISKAQGVLIGLSIRSAFHSISAISKGRNQCWQRDLVRILMFLAQLIYTICLLAYKQFYDTFQQMIDDRIRQHKLEVQRKVLS